MDDPDLYRLAATMINLHGEAAAMQASLKADALLEAGDAQGEKVWRRIVERIRYLLDQDMGGATRH